MFMDALYSVISTLFFRSIHPQSIHPSIHPSIICRFSGIGSWGQQLEQRNPDVPIPGHFLQLFRGDPDAFPGQSFPGVSSQWDVPGTPHQGGPSYLLLLSLKYIRHVGGGKLIVQLCTAPSSMCLCVTWDWDQHMTTKTFSLENSVTYYDNNNITLNYLVWWRKLSWFGLTIPTQLLPWPVEIIFLKSNYWSFLPSWVDD